MQFNKFKIVLSFIPNNSCKLALNCKVIPWYSFENKTSDPNFFKPAYLAKYYYDSKIVNYDYYETNVRKIHVVFPYSHVNKFIRDKLTSYPQWFGYFDNTFKANKEYMIHGRKQIVQELKEVDHINDDELFSKIAELKFKT